MMAIDPVCGMEVEFDADTKKNVPAATHNDREYFFCSQDCKDAFTDDPSEYV